MAERLSLPAFQAQLARKLAQSADRPAAADWLGVSWRGVNALLPLAQAGEIFEPSALQRLPHAQPWVAGVASLRGALAVVIDWALLLGLQSAAPGAVDADDDGSSYWVSLNTALGVPAALCADRLGGLRNRGDLQWAGARPLADWPAVTGLWRDADGRHWYEIDLVLLSQVQAFLDIRAPATATRPF